jgi:integrase
MKRRDGVFKRNRAWWIDFADADGKRHRKKAAPTYELAKLIYRDTVTAIAKGEVLGVREEGMRVREFVERIWLPETRTRLNPDWMVRVTGALDAVLLPTFGDYSLLRLTRHVIDAWAAQRSTQVGASAYNKEVWILKNVCKVAEEKHYLVRSPATHVKRRREPKGRIRYLNPEERAALLNGKLVTITAKDGRSWAAQIGPSETLRLYIAAALQTGARRGELMRLCWADIDFRAGLITFANTKNGDLRTVPMTTTMRALLLSLPRPLDSSAFILPRRKPLVLTRSFARLCQRLEIKNLTFHDLRHDVGSQLAMANIPLRTIAEILGHRKLEMTLRYAHLAPGHLAEAMTVLDQAKLGDPNTKMPFSTGTISAPA